MLVDNIAPEVDFFKKVIEIGGLYYLDDDNYVLRQIDDSPVVINVGEKEGVPLMMYSPKMKAGKHAIICPLVETNQSHSAERAWFFESRSMVTGAITKLIVKTLLELIVEGKSKNKKALKLANVMSDADEKTLKELKRIPADSFLRIFYSRKKMTAQLQTDIYDDDFRLKYKTIRKKTWTAFEKIMAILLGTEHIHEDFRYVSDRIGIPEADANLTIFIDWVEAIAPHAKVVLGVDYPVHELKEHLKKINEYRKKCVWFTPTTNKGSLQDAPTPGFKASALPASLGTTPSHIRPAILTPQAPQTSLPAGVLNGPQAVAPQACPAVAPPVYQQRVAYPGPAPIVQPAYNTQPTHQTPVYPGASQAYPGPGQQSYPGPQNTGYPASNIVGQSRPIYPMR